MVLAPLRHDGINCHQQTEPGYKNRESTLADIRPFHGVHYNTARVKDLARVICPPYDIISPQAQQELYQRSDYNFIRIEFGRELPQDKDTDNRYTRAASALKNWLEQGVLQIDDRPSFYIDEHHFTYQGKVYRRRGLNCLVKLEEWNKMVVRPHEGTLSRPKSDRLNLLWALQADTSPVMALYEDRQRQVAPLLDKSTRGKPSLNIKGGAGESHQVWTVTDAVTNEKIHDYLAGQPLYIADGHHRYESALNYQRERRSSLPVTAAEEPFDFVLMSLADMADPGLIILPAHRLVRGMSPSAIAGLKAGLKACFHVTEVTPDTTDVLSQINKLLPKDNGELKILVYGLKKGKFILLTLRDYDIIRPMIPYFHSELYQKLDVSIVDHVILEELLGLTHEMTGAFVDYANDAREAIRRVMEQEYQLAFIVNPVRPDVIKAIADAGDRMPRKSTYFYPKVPAGLVFYKFG
jgi:uncharacterized protein (DUF1015 family)